MNLSAMTIDLIFDKYGRRNTLVILPIDFNNKDYVYDFVVRHCKLSHLFRDNTKSLSTAELLMVNINDGKVQFTDYKISELTDKVYVQIDTDNLLWFTIKLLDYIVDGNEDAEMNYKPSEVTIPAPEEIEFNYFETNDNQVTSVEIDKDISDRTLLFKFANGMTIVAPCSVKAVNNKKDE